MDSDRRVPCWFFEHVHLRRRHRRRHRHRPLPEPRGRADFLGDGNGPLSVPRVGLFKRVSVLEVGMDSLCTICFPNMTVMKKHDNITFIGNQTLYELDRPHSYSFDLAILQTQHVPRHSRNLAGSGTSDPLTSP